ncbi:DUF3828 domain-containing protein [Mucilaginibacter sp. KACC 22063]|uniref:DUF3828 domain-containing protein n=1 Tax=Mucilaginibacter sp. KACC 22063 TaxID=3025666 RepID=UPI00236709B4|nr:DUF3828 domain-containing protein [Mucilaginibacter sp. KACC 22063]WDF54050.1 DUF3828 domain-containing protein [Mucilaginibacter sp. KACC 22063]
MKLILTLLLVATAITSKAQSSSPEQAITMLNKFYTAYMSELSSDKDLKIIDQTLSSLRQKNCTPACLKQFKKLAVKTDADPFLKAQDCDKEWLKTLHIKKDPKKSNIYAVSYTAINDTNEKIVIHLLVVNQNGLYKIAAIE